MVFMTSCSDRTAELRRCNRLMCDVTVQVSVDPTLWERSRVEDQDHVTRGRPRVSSEQSKWVCLRLKPCSPLRTKVDRFQITRSASVYIVTAGTI